MDQESDVSQFMIAHDIRVDTEVTYPMPTRAALFKDLTPLSTEEAKEYRSIDGGLGWFATALRVQSPVDSTSSNT